MSGAALFGKLPAHGDFVARGFRHDQQARIDAWLATALADARAAFGAEFVERFDAALPWCCDGDGIAGALAASQDSLGRRFPILLLIADAQAPRCEALLYTAIGERWDADRLLREAGDAAPLDLATIARWWCDGAARGSRDGPCPPDLLVAMLGQKAPA